MNNLKRIRTEVGLTQAELAETSKISVRMIQHYEQGQKDINKAEAIKIYKLAKALNTNMENIIEKEKAGH